MLFIEDKDFIRGKVPMTKEDVRHLTVAKLDLKEDSVLIDIGAGSGSVGIEAGNFCRSGKVYGIEVNPNGIEVIKQNLEKFNMGHYELIEGMAPEDIPTDKGILVDRMFVGGSKGNIKPILEWFLENSKEDSKVVVNTITLESLGETMDSLKKLEFLDIDVTNISIAKNKKIGRYNMMMGENPIYIITARRSN